MLSLNLPNHTSCSACHLHATRKNVVPGFGNPASPLVFVGEAPGKDEDELGLPFIGPAGKLLRGIIDAVPQMNSSDFFYTNIYHCRPPLNEVSKTKGSLCPSIWLNAELQKISPAVVVAVGKTACDYFRPTEIDMPMRWHSAKDTYDEVRRCWVVGMYHPSYLLRQGVQEGQREGNVALVSVVASLQRAAYYLVAAGWGGSPDIIEG